MERVLRIIAERLERIEALEAAQIRLELRVGEIAIHLEGKIMSLQDDFQAASSANAASQTALMGKVDGALTLLDTLAQLIKANPGGSVPNADVQAAIDAMNARTAAMDAEGAKVDTTVAADSPAPAPAPEPAPAPPDDGGTPTP